MKQLLLFLLLAFSVCQTVLAHDPATGWWWNKDESGRGFSIEKQGDMIFFAAYLYDDSGNPTWYTALLSKDPAHGYIGTLQQFAGGQTLTGTYQQPNILNEDAGEIILDFSAHNKGTLTWPGGTVEIERFIFAVDNSDGHEHDDSADPAAITRGRELYEANCSNSSCHGLDPAQNRNNILSGSSPAAIFSAFMNVQRMINAGVPDRVSNDEVEDIAVYLKSIKR